MDWAAQLREFVTTFARNDFSWTQPNRRFVSQGIYLPGMYSDEIGSLAVAIDTSGSISQAELDRMSSELQGIRDVGGHPQRQASHPLGRSHPGRHVGPPS